MTARSQSLTAGLVVSDLHDIIQTNPSKIFLQITCCIQNHHTLGPARFVFSFCLFAIINTHREAMLHQCV